MSKEKFSVRVRVADELFSKMIELPRGAFQPERVVHDETFGWLDGIFVAIKCEDWESAQKYWGHEVAS